MIDLVTQDGEPELSSSSSSNVIDLLTENEEPESNEENLILYRDLIKDIPDFIKNMTARQSYEISHKARSSISFTKAEQQQLVTFLRIMKDVNAGFKRHLDDERFALRQIRSFTRLIPGRFRGKLAIDEIWLNDNIINEYGRLLSQRPSMKNNLFINSKYLAIMERYKDTPDFLGPRGDKSIFYDRFVHKMAFETSELIYFPCNLDNTHWILIILSLKKKEVYAFDSSSMGNGERPREIADTYLIPFCKNVLRRKFGNTTNLPTFDINLEEGEWKYYDINCPQQLNGYDCGVFVCMFMDFASDDIDLQNLSDFSYFSDGSCDWAPKVLQANIDYFRFKIAIDIIRGDLGY